MISALDYIRGWGPRAPTFTFVCGDGTNIHLPVALMHSVLSSGQFDHRISMVQIDPSWFWFMLHEEKSISPKRIIELSKRDPKTLGPIIYCEIGNHHFLCDGHHRLALAIIRGLPEIPAFVLPEPAWRHLELDGLPSMTQEELRDYPITERSY